MLLSDLARLTWSSRAPGTGVGASSAAMNFSNRSDPNVIEWWASTRSAASESALSKRNSDTVTPARPAASANRSSSAEEILTSRLLSLSCTFSPPAVQLYVPFREMSSPKGCNWSSQDSLRSLKTLGPVCSFHSRANTRFTRMGCRAECPWL